MRVAHVTRAAAFLVALVSTVAAFAQSTQRAKRSVISSAGRPSGAVAPAYGSAKQAFVGSHAPSNQPVKYDGEGRPLLRLVTINRGEALAIPAASDEGGFASADLDRVAHLLRAMSGDEQPVDPRLLALVYRIEAHFEAPEIRVVSGYRLPRPGSRSNHGRGRAMDLVVPAVADEEVARFAREMGFVGVGVYPTSQFVHVDVRPRSYFWVDYSGPHMRNRERGVFGDLAAKSDAAALARGEAPVEPFAFVTNVDAALQACGVTSAGTQAADEDEDEE
jgi:uncharacterized protein YcbK (DUF882 family)